MSDLEWQLGQLREIAEPVGNKWLPLATEKDVPYVGLEHILPENPKIAEYGRSSDVISTKNMFNAGDTLFGKLRPYLKKVALADLSGVCSTDIIPIRANQKVDPLLLYYLLSSPKIIAKAVESSAGNVMPRASWSDLADIEIAIPPLPEQKKIAEILSGIDSLANRLSTLYQKRQEFLRSLSLSLLGLRHCHSKFHYHPVSLGNCITLSRGVDITKTCMVPGPYPVISSSGVSGWHNSFTHETEGVVVGRKGSIGNVHYAETAHWVHDTSLGISDYKGNNKRYIYHLLKNLDLANFGTASGSPSLNRNDVHPIAVNLPSHADQIQIATILDAEEAFSHGLQKKIFTIKHLKKSVASDLLSGRKRVTL